MWGVPPCWGVGLGGRNPPAKFTCCSGSGQRHSSRWPQFPLEDSVVFAVCGNRVKIKCAVSTRQTPKHSLHARPSGEAASVPTARPAAGRGWLRAPGASPTGGRRGGRPEESQPARSPQTPHHPARSSLDHQLSVGTAPSSEGLAAPLRVRMKAKARVQKLSPRHPQDARPWPAAFRPLSTSSSPSDWWTGSRAQPGAHSPFPLQR